MHSRRHLFKEALNEALSVSLQSAGLGPERKPFEVVSKPLGLRPWLDPAGFNQLNDELENEGLVDQLKAAADE